MVALQGAPGRPAQGQAQSGTREHMLMLTRGAGVGPCPSHPLPHLALLGVRAPAKGALLQLPGVAPVAGRELLEAPTLQEAHLLGLAPLLQDLLLGLEL